MNGQRDETPPFMQWLQDWVSDLPPPLLHAFGVIGAIAGFIIGLLQPKHHPQYLFALMGYFFGYMLFQLIAMIIRYTIYWTIMGLVFLTVYYAFFKN